MLERRERLTVLGALGHGDHAEVEGLVGDEEPVRLKPEHHGQERLSVQSGLEVEFDDSIAGFVRRAQHMIIRHQERGGDEESGAVMASAACPDRHAPDRARRQEARFEETDSDEVIAPHEAFKSQHIGTEGVGGQLQTAARGGCRRCLLDRRRQRPIGAQACQPLLHALRGVGVQDAAPVEDAQVTGPLRRAHLVAVASLLHLGEIFGIGLRQLLHCHIGPPPGHRPNMDLLPVAPSSI